MADEENGLTDSRLPRGIYYEAKRKRYRVRLYIGTNVVYRSYHKDVKDALIAWAEAVKARPTLTLPTPIERQSLLSLEDQIAALNRGNN